MKHQLISATLLLFTFPAIAQTSSEDFDRVSIKAGFSVIQHLEPQIYGVNQNTQSASTTYGGTLKGIETLNGFNFKVYYFLKNNIGFYFDFGAGLASNSVFYQNDTQPFIQYESKGDFNSQSLGVVARFTSEKIPVNLLVGTSIGRFGYTMSLSELSNGNGQWYDGTYDILKFGIEGMVEYRIFKGLNLFSEINYSTQLGVDADDFTIDYLSDNGAYYRIDYNSPSMAAIRITLGLGYNF